MAKYLSTYLLPGLLIAALVACQSPGDSNSQTLAERNAELPGFDLRNLDTTVEPCTDFFQYATGGWQAQHEIPKTESRWGTFNLLRQRNFEKLHGLLDSLVARNQGPALPNFADQLRTQYTAGLDTVKIENRGLEPLQPFLRQIVDLRSLEVYRAFMIESKRYGLPMPFSLGVEIDDRQPEQYVLKMGQSGLGLPDRSYYLRSDSAGRALQEKYRRHMARMLGFYPEDWADDSRRVTAIYELEKELAQAQMSRTARRNPDSTYHKMSRAQAAALMPRLGLEALWQDLDLKFDSVVVAQPQFLRRLDELLAQVPMETWRDYHRWHLLRTAAPFLPYQIQKAHFGFYETTLQGTEQMKPRWRRVAGELGSGLGEALGQLFVERYFSPEAKKDVERMVEDMRNAYAERIANLAWMSKATQEKALKKLAAFSYEIGYPRKWDDYEGLSLDPGNYWQNELLIRFYNVADNLAKLGQPVDDSEWYMPAYLVNAYYSPRMNEIVFPAGILQPPFFDKDGDMAINYGGIGGVIAHEFTHGFDDQGSKYGPQGALEDWWTADDRRRFDALGKRLARQYSQYEPVEGAPVNGQLTLGENIADLGGLTMAYYGYKKRLDRLGLRPNEKAGFTWQQRIFLGWAQVWASEQTPAFTRKQVVTDPHSPARYRVNGPVRNMRAFAKAWNCQPGDKMGLADSLRVQIW